MTRLALFGAVCVLLVGWVILEWWIMRDEVEG